MSAFDRRSYSGIWEIEISLRRPFLAEIEVCFKPVIAVRFALAHWLFAGQHRTYFELLPHNGRYLIA